MTTKELKVRTQYVFRYIQSKGLNKEELNWLIEQLGKYC